MLTYILKRETCNTKHIETYMAHCACNVYTFTKKRVSDLRKGKNIRFCPEENLLNLIHMEESVILLKRGCKIQKILSQFGAFSFKIFCSVTYCNTLLKGGKFGSSVKRAVSLS